MSQNTTRQLLTVMACCLLFFLFTVFAIGKPASPNTGKTNCASATGVQSIGTNMIWETLSRQFIQYPN